MLQDAATSTLQIATILLCLTATNQCKGNVPVTLDWAVALSTQTWLWEYEQAFMCSLQKYTFVCCGYSILGQATRLSDRFKGGKGGARLVMYFSVHSCTSPSNDYTCHVMSCHVMSLFCFIVVRIAW